MNVLSEQQIDLVKIALEKLGDSCYADGDHSTCIDVRELEKYFGVKDIQVAVIPRSEGKEGSV